MRFGPSRQDVRWNPGPSPGDRLSGGRLGGSWGRSVALRDEESFVFASVLEQVIAQTILFFNELLLSVHSPNCYVITPLHLRGDIPRNKLDIQSTSNTLTFPSPLTLEECRFFYASQYTLGGNQTKRVYSSLGFAMSCNVQLHLICRLA